MFFNYITNYCCLHCNSSYTSKEYFIITIKSYLFSLGKNKSCCPVCKKKNSFIELTDDWNHILSILNKKGYHILDCSMHAEYNNSNYAFIKFAKNIEMKVKPKFMSYEYIWQSQDTSILRKDENLKVLTYHYKEEQYILKEYSVLTQNLLKWVNNI